MIEKIVFIHSYMYALHCAHKPFKKYCIVLTIYNGSIGAPWTSEASSQ